MNKHMPIVSPSVTIEGRVLAKALKPMVRVLSKSTVYPVLSTVRLTVNCDGLRIVATDLDIEISTTLDVNDSEGAFDNCVDAQALLGIASAAGPAPICMRPGSKEVETGKRGERTPCATLLITVDDGAAEYEIDNLIKPDAFPPLPGERGALLEKFTNGMLVDALRRCENYVSLEETRYYRNGVCWTQGTDGREFVATDGHRLLRYRYDADPGDGSKRIIPRKTVSLLTKFFARSDADIYAVGEGKIDVLVDGFTIRSKLIDGMYPDYGRVIPPLVPEMHVLACTKTGLDHALALATAMPSGNLRHGRAIHVHEQDGLLCLKLRNADTGTAVAHTVFEWPQGVPDVGLNANYLRDSLATCQGDVRFAFKDASSPILILDGDAAMTRVQMPMRV